MKAYPKLEEIKKRPKKSNSDVPLKKMRLDDTSAISESAIDITEQFIIERLTPELAANLVITGMVSRFTNLFTKRFDVLKFYSLYNIHVIIFIINIF